MLNRFRNRVNFDISPELCEDLVELQSLVLHHALLDYRMSLLTLTQERNVFFAL